jgi:ketosteroid isomerase-like protein
MTHAEALAFAGEWAAAWNAHDLVRILAHYADDFTMTSPYIAAIAGEPSGTLRGKEAVGAYWRAALGRFPDLRFELTGVLVGVESVAICYNGVRGVRACEVLTFDAEGRAVRAVAHYDGP